MATSSPATRPWAVALAATLLLVGCGDQVVSPQPSAADPSTTPSSGVTSAASPTPPPSIVPAPFSESAVYAPHPGAVVVAIDPGHGGCLDWGVPDPSLRGEAYAEKTMTLGIGRALRDLLEAEGITVVMIREDDSALAGDHYPPLDCDGDPWRDVNGDGIAGFGAEVPEATRTRDELQARLDLANLTQADVLISLHINSPFDAGQTIEIAFTETFYTDETPWGTTVTARLAELVQAGVVDALDAVATYDRGDRGITAHNFYMVAPTLFEATPERPDRYRQPTRGALMPTVLSEIGSITLRAEHDLLVGGTGQRAVANGLLAALAAYLGDRPLAARIALAGTQPGAPPAIVEGDGPPFWPPAIGRSDEDLELRLSLTNTGTEAWPAGLRLAGGWTETDEPYLAGPPPRVEPLRADVPALLPGESVELAVTLPSPRNGARHVAWVTLLGAGLSLSDVGAPPLQVATAAP